MFNIDNSSGIYSITNVIDGKVYVGSSINVENRVKEHLRCLRLGNHYNHKLQRAWSKHGEESFVFECVWKCQKQYLLFFEQIMIDGNDAVKSGYNLAPKAGNTLGYKHTDETKKTLSEMKKGKNYHTEETLKTLSEKCKKSWTPER